MTPTKSFTQWLQGLGLSTLLLCAVTEAHDPAAHTTQHKASDLGSAVAMDAQGRLWLASKATTADGEQLVLQSSDDQGRHWTTPQTVSHETVVASGDERPRIAFGAQGQIYLSYSHPLAAPHTSELRFLRSDDGGLHFSGAITVHQNHDVITHGFASMAVDHAGRVFIAWIDKRDQQAARANGTTYAGAALYYAVSQDGGRSFKGDYKIADHACECCRSAIATDGAGQPLLLWRHVFAPNIRDHALTMLTPDGKPAAPQRASFDNWTLDACPHQGPALAIGEDSRRHQTWFSGNADGGGLFYASQNTDGALGTPERLGSEQAAHADVAVAGRHIALAWTQFNGSATELLSRNSYDGGATWTERTLSSTTSDADQPHLASGPRGIVLVWRSQESRIQTFTLEPT
ncbi:MAG: sialidase family protein [Pseudomonadota bacterium]